MGELLCPISHDRVTPSVWVSLRAMQSDLTKNAKDAFYEAAEAASPGAKKTELRAFWHSVVGMLLRQVCSYGMVGFCNLRTRATSMLFSFPLYSERMRSNAKVPTVRIM